MTAAGPQVGLSRFRPAAILPVALVLAVMLGLEVAYGAEPPSALLYLGYELAFLLLPGWLVYRVLSSRPGGAIRQIAVGWVVGLTLEILAFSVTAALDMRGLFTVFPLIVGVPPAFVLLRRRKVEGRDRATEPASRRFSWTLAAVCSLAMGLLAVAYFPAAHLPGGETVTYFRDFPWHLGIAAEAKLHWPILDPNVSGEPFPYHYFVHIHVAAASQVTGIDLPVIFFRLYFLPLLVLPVLLFVTAGRTFFGSAWVGLLAAGLALLVGELQLETSQDFVPHLPFLGATVTFLARSPSFLFGLPFFLALVVLIGERVTGGQNGSRGDWALVAIVAAGATNAKVIVLPLILVGVILFSAWKLHRRDRIPAGVAWASLLVLTALGLTYVSQYAGHSSGIVVSPFATTDQMPVIAFTKDYLLSELPGFPLRSAALTLGGAALGVVGLFGAQLLGIVWLGARGRWRDEDVWVVSFVVAAILAACVLGAPGTADQLYLVAYGVTIGWLAASAGFRNLWGERPRQVAWLKIAAIGVPWFVLLVLIMRLPLESDLFSGADAPALMFLFWYGGLFASLAVACLIVGRILRPRRWWIGTFLASAFVLIGILGTVADYVTPALSSGSESAASIVDGNTLTPDAYSALTWIRDNTSEDAVVAINSSDPFAFKWAAFSERRAFLQGWAYSRRSIDAGYDPNALAGGDVNLFPERIALNAAAFAGSREALETLAADYGVGYLIVDEAGNLPVDAAGLKGLTTTVYENEDMRVLRIDAGAGAGT